MSWKDAKKEASLWLPTLNLPADLVGQEIDLSALADKLPHAGRFREMILRAAARELKSRGAKIK
jgi:hypothetical protein